MTQPNEQLTEAIRKHLNKMRMRFGPREVLYDDVGEGKRLIQLLLEENKRSQQMETEWRDAFWGLHRKHSGKDAELEQVKAERDALIEENTRLRSPNIESLNYEKGQIDMRLSGVHAMNMLESFVDLFETNGGKNFLTTTLEAPARNKRYEVTITNLNGELSAGEKMNQLVIELSEKDKVLEWYVSQGLLGSSDLGTRARTILSLYKPKEVDNG